MLPLARLSAAALTVLLVSIPATADEGLVGHWKLATNSRDVVSGKAAANHGVQFANGSAVFNGRNAWLEADTSAFAPGDGGFSISVWIHTDDKLDDVLGDVASSYDAAARNGFNLSLMNYAGVTSAQSNWRNVHFGIDAAKVEPAWKDCGRPGQNRYVKSLVVHNDALYAAVWEPGAGQRGHLYRYAGGKKWIDCGSPGPANSITGLAVYDGQIYAGTELYSGGGSSLPLSPNTNHGGQVFRYEGGTRWTNCGKVADVRSISGLAVYQGKLYAGTGTSGGWRDQPRTRGMYRYDGGQKWTSCGCPGKRIVHLCVYNGDLLGLSYDDGGVFRYDGGSKWTQLGPVPETTQVYSAAVYQGQLHVGTWPTGSVFRMDGPQKWTNTGQLGDEKEVMGMAVYNGKLYAGTLPLAQVYRYDGPHKWLSTGQLDRTPDVKYRRAWSQAVFQGRLYCGVLPSGRVYSLEAGKSVTYDRALPAGWRHLAAIKDRHRLQLYIDGREVAQSTEFAPAEFELTGKKLKIGFGQHDYFKGRMKDFRLYRRPLSADDVKRLFKAAPSFTDLPK